MFNLSQATMSYGYVSGIRQMDSPHYNLRPPGSLPTLLVIHNISLPPKQYEGNYIEDLFLGKLNYQAHPYFDSLRNLRVSSHFLIRRHGELIQFVSCDKSAWHAGVSQFEGQNECNSFSIGIEMEGSDEEPFIEHQYYVLAQLTLLLSKYYPIKNIVGHNDIASERKTDPGPHFDWAYYSDLLRHPEYESN